MDTKRPRSTVGRHSTEPHRTGRRRISSATTPHQQRNDATSAAQRRRTASLEAELELRSKSTIDLERLRTALSWYLDLQHDTGIRAFIDPSDEEGKRYNKRTLELFALYMHTRGSRQRQRVGTHIAANTIAAYVSTRSKQPWPGHGAACGQTTRTMYTSRGCSSRGEGSNAQMESWEASVSGAEPFERGI